MIMLIVGAHPDDIEIGVGGTIHKLREKHVIHGLVLTSGGLRGSCDEREAATISAAEIIGYYPHFRRLQDGSFSESEAEATILKKIQAIGPDLIIGHAKHDKHRDHVVAHIATISAARRAKNLLLFEGPYSHEFSPNLFSELGETDMDAKVRALKEHSKALRAMRSYLAPETIRLQAKLCGVRVECKYAEAFEVLVLSTFFELG